MAAGADDRERVRRLITAAAAHRRVKRALGLLRQASQALAPELADVRLVGELTVETDADAQELLELVRLGRHRHGRLEVLIVTAPAAEPPA